MAALAISFVVDERCYKVTVKGAWLDATVGALVARVVTKRGLDPTSYAAPASLAARVVRLALADGAVVPVAAATAPLVVVTALTCGFAPIFALWHSRFARATDARVALVVCALDAAAEAAARGASTAARPVRVLGAAEGFRPPADRADLWRQRLAAVARVVAEERKGGGRPVVHSDCDAFWVGDPRPALAAAGNAPVLFSVDHGLGRGAKAFALCCGFFRVAPGAASLGFLARWRAATAACGDDQVAVNALYDAGEVAANVGLLPYEKFQRCNRRHPTTTLPVVWHPWLDAPVAEKAAVWGAVLADLDAGARRLLDRFYDSERTPDPAARAGPARGVPAVCLDAAALAAIS